MTRLLAILILALIPFNALAYQEDIGFGEEPKLSVIVSPTNARNGSAYLQEELLLTVRVASIYPFEALDVDIPTINDATINTLVRAKTRKVRSYAGAGYIWETVIAVYPDASGTLTIPSITATVQIEPEKDQPLSFTDQSPPKPIIIRGIPARFDELWWLVSRKVTIEESWSKPPDEIRYGDIVRREIKITASGVPHERMPVPEHPRTRGVDILDLGGTARTNETAEGVTGVMHHAWDLKMSGDRLLYVAPIGIAYWHPEENVRLKASLQGYRLEPLPADGAAIAATLMAEARAAHTGNLLLAGLVVALLLLPVIIIAALAIWVAIPTRTDRRLRQDLHRTTTPADRYRACQSWARASGLDLAATAASVPAMQQLQDALFGNHLAAQGENTLASGLIRHARQRRLRVFWRRLATAANRILGTPKPLDAL